MSQLYHARWNTIQQESLVGEKFGEFGKLPTIHQIKTIQISTYPETPIHYADMEPPHQNKHFRNVFITCFICILFIAGVDHLWDYQHIATVCLVFDNKQNYKHP